MTARSIMSHSSETLDVFTRRSVPKVEIELVGQKPGLVNSYTTGDQIEGSANITVDADTRFDEVEIVLQGTSYTSVERAACPGRVGSQQMFLKLRQPINESDYPCPRIMEAGRTYSFPFMFVVPDRLLPHVCTHPRTNIHIHNAHTMLPPTLGDPMLAGNGTTLLDDIAPEMSQISYILRAAVLKRSSADQDTLKTIANVGKKVRIIPIVEEEPPIDVVDHPYYCTRKEKTVKRGFLRGKLGRMVASASQPQPIRLLPLSCEPSDTVSTMTTVQLRFDPVGDEQPPKLGSMTSKIKASTFYSYGPWEDFPMQSGSIPFSQVGRGLFNESVPISNMCVGSAKWVKHSTSTSTECERRDSMQSMTSDTSSALSTSSSGTYYTASVVIPISLPKNKTFVPTFHSCLMSRTYSLDLSLTYHTPGANVLTPTISLRLPIQVITQPRYSDSLKSEMGMVVTQEELDEFFQPRSVAPPNESVVDVSLAPPGYSERIVRSGFQGLRTVS